MIQLLLNLGLATIMFEVGLTLTAQDFHRLLETPRAVITGLGAQMVLLPAIAAGLLIAFPTTPEMTIGVLLIAAAPGGVTSNLMTLLARGDVALALTITALSTVASTITLPLIVDSGASLLGTAGLAFAMPVGMMMRGITLTTLLPLAIGMAARHYWPGAALRWEPRLRRVSTLVFAAIVVVTFAANADTFKTHAGTVGPLLLLLNVLAMCGAAGLARLNRLDRRATIAISFETGLQNAALAIYLAIAVLQQPAFAVPAIIYAAAMNVSVIAVLVALGFRRLNVSAVEKNA